MKGGINGAFEFKEKMIGKEEWLISVMKRASV